ncbi:MAG: adenosylcobinamide-GDP ribazoletransferase [Leptolinea sp.]
MKYLRQAFTQLTILPFSSTEAPQPGDSGRAAIWFPLVGLIIGSLLAGGWWLLSSVFPPILAAPLTLAFWALLSGGLHLDGLADCCDGLLCSASPARRLEIMTDSRLGSFAGVGLVLYLLIKFAAIFSLAPLLAPYIFILAALISRWLVLLAGKQPLARLDGMAADFANGLTTRSFLVGAILPFGFALLGGWRGMAATGLAVLAALIIFRFTRSRIGGVTGDVFGLTIEITELVVLLTYASR